MVRAEQGSNARAPALFAKQGLSDRALAWLFVGPTKSQASARSERPWLPNEDFIDFEGLEDRRAEPSDPREPAVGAISDRVTHRANAPGFTSASRLP